MKAQKIYLFRHGELVKQYHHRYIGHLDAPLSKTGKNQAQKINSFIRDLKNPKLVTSDLKRTFSELSSVTPLKRKEFREMNFGKWDGLLWEEIQESFPETTDQFLKSPASFNFPDGESFTKLSKRVIPLFDKLLNEQSECVVCVFHAGVIRAILSKKLNIPLSKVFNFKIDYGKCTILEKVNGNFLLSSLNTDI